MLARIIGGIITIILLYPVVHLKLYQITIFFKYINLIFYHSGF